MKGLSNIFLTTEVETSHVRVCEKALTAPFETIISHLEDIAVILVFQNQGSLLLHDKTGYAGFLDLYDFLKNGLDPFRREPEGGFV